eukprot:TRINITY_DN6482_c0_g1_i2.p1 TRINITY_DN6482_c0_g1~~TRINITY_DN6482_c0_g1_i2.p1  ORF type:complete len:366 (-),score=63.60 TRINITY_DN6482_c0_g1_i2:3-1100(-)
MDGFEATDSSSCPPKITLYLNNDYTDYFMLSKIYYRYNAEIALHTISHKTGKKTTLSEWFKEIEYSRRFVEEMSLIPTGAIVGFRAPFFAYNAEMFTVLEDLKFLYDSSISDRNIPGQMFWPYTLEHGVAQTCDTGVCPEVSLPNLWEIPISVLFDSTGKINSAIDPVGEPDDLLELLKYNFLEHYNGNRSPLTVTLHPAWLIADQRRVKVIQDFFSFAANFTNVFFRSGKDIIEWMKHPVQASEIPSGNCSYHITSEETCKNGNRPLECRFADSSSWFLTCASDCYTHYPSGEGNFRRINSPQVYNQTYSFSYLEEQTVSGSSNPTQRSDEVTKGTEGDPEETEQGQVPKALILFVLMILLSHI